MSTPIYLRCDSDEDAHRAATILEACGFEVIREIESVDTEADAAKRIGVSFKLTTREQGVFDGVIRGWSNEEIARELEVSRATVKWHMHNVFAKTGTGNREQLLRLVLPVNAPRRVR